MPSAPESRRPCFVLTVLRHALLELTAVFLPRAGRTLASRRDGWNELLAASFVTLAVAIPKLIAVAVWEVQVWPRLVAAASPPLSAHRGLPFR